MFAHIPGQSNIHLHIWMRNLRRRFLPIHLHASILSNPVLPNFRLLLFNIKDLPSHLQHPPILPNTILVFLLRQRCPCHIYICIRLRSLSRDPMNPSTRLLLFASSRLRLSFRGMVTGAFGGLARLRDNVGLLCVCSQNRGSSGCPLGRGVRRLLGNGLVRLPTGLTLAYGTQQQVESELTRSIQNPPLRSIIWKKSSYCLLLNQLSLAISKFDQKWHMLYFSPSIASGSISGIEA